MMAPPPPSRPPTDRQKLKQFWQGIGLGMIPVVIAWIALGLGFRGGNTTLVTGLVYLVILLYLAVMVTGILFMRRKEREAIGRGLLMMLFVGPIVWSVGCIAILATPK